MDNTQTLMNEKTANEKLLAFLAYAMYFLTGISCIVVGSSLTHLVGRYNVTLDKVVLIQSAYALGRVSTVYVTGRLVEKIGTNKVLAYGTLFIGIFLFGLATSENYYLSMLFAIVGGIGMGTQDTVCPVFLSIAYKEKYSGALSAGQGWFGLGQMLFPFLIGMMLMNKIPFYYAFYVVGIVPVLMLMALPFAKVPKHVQADAGEEIEPMETRHFTFAYLAIIIACATYCGVVNTVSLYTTSLAEHIGISSSNAAFLLTVYNVGGVIGAFAFIAILRKYNILNVMIVSSIIAFVAIIVTLVFASTWVYFVGFFIAGFVLIAMFSMIVSVATRINYKHISRAGSVVAMSGGIFDMISPVITGLIVRYFAVPDTFVYALVMITITIGSTLFIKKNVIHSRG